MPSVEERVLILEDIASIKRLKADYCYYADIWTQPPSRAEAFAALFALDATWNVGHKVCSGRAEIAAELRALPQITAIKVGIHMAFNPRIDVWGDQAAGTWHFLIPTVSDPSGIARWTCGMYFEKYVRTTDGWRFQDVRAEIAFAPSV